MVCSCLGRERIIEPLFAQQKLGSPKRRKKKLFPPVKSRASNELREPHQRSQFGEAQRTHPCTYRFNQFHLFDGLFMFGARADNRTAFCAAKTWFAVAAATARSRCGLRSREYTKFSVKRPRRSENSGTHRTHPRRFHLSDIRKDICLCLVRERIIGPLFAQQKLGSP